MEIKVSTTSAKAAKVTIGLDVKSAEVLRLFMVKAVDTSYMSEAVEEIYEQLCDKHEGLTLEDIETMLAGIISGLDGEVA